MKSIKLISIFLLVSFNVSSAIELDLRLNIKDPIYTEDINVLFIESIESSYKVNGQKYVIESESHLFNAAKYYYIPSVSVSSQVKQKFDRPGHPSPFTEFTLDLSARMKLWSNTTDEQKDAAYYSLLSSKEKYNENINDIYGRINQNLMKIETSREFLVKSREYRKRMDILLKQMGVSAGSGILKKSDRIFAEVTVKKFDESVLNVLSQIELYKSQIDNITPRRLYKDGYGLSKFYMSSMMHIEPEFFNINNVMNKNFSILSRKSELMSEKKTAQSNNEYFKVELLTVHDIKEHEKSSSKNDQNQAIYGYTYDNNGDSFIGIQFSFTGLDYGNYQSQMSEYELYKKKMIEFDEFIHGINIDLITLKQQYELITQRIENVNNQISLTTDVIKNQMKEMMVDESSVLDIFRNISSLSDLEISQLSTQNELIDTVNRIYVLNSVLPGNYVIN
ncbi:TolC family protein [Aliivibrio salmonicida]|uniref:TolC family protein n=1 Tax=Aliivibrio salmonicida TaxID=40269 RepID=UPI00406C4E67